MSLEAETVVVATAVVGEATVGATVAPPGLERKAVEGLGEGVRRRLPAHPDQRLS